VLTVNGLLVVFLAALVFNMARGLDVNCGCFSTASDAQAMSAGWYLLRDVGFLAVGAFLFYAVLRHLIAESKLIWGRAARQILSLVILSAVAAVAVNALRPDRLPLIGDWSVPARITTATGERMDISLDEAENLFFTHAAVFIDARSEEDYERGHIQNARCLPWQEVDLRFMGVTEALDPEMPIVTYCDGEKCESSHNLALFLRDAGFLNTRVLVNGWTLWQQAGLPVESGAPRDDR
jgi:rhodanese-related sulfurtransferase